MPEYLAFFIAINKIFIICSALTSNQTLYAHWSVSYFKISDLECWSTWLQAKNGKYTGPFKPVVPIKMVIGNNYSLPTPQLNTNFQAESLSNHELGNYIKSFQFDSWRLCSDDHAIAVPRTGNVVSNYPHWYYLWSKKPKKHSHCCMLESERR